MTDFDAIPLADMVRDHVNGEQIAHLTVSSHSMSPLIDTGDIIGLQPVDVANVAPGQIITVVDPKDPTDLLTHRAAAVQHGEREPFYLLTRGDRMLVFDALMRADSLVGQVVWRIRNGKRVRLDSGSGAWLSNQLGRISDLERRLISGVSVKDVMLRSDSIAAVNDLTRSRRESRTARVVRAASRGSSRILTAVVLLFTQKEEAGDDAVNVSKQVQAGRKDNDRS